MLFVYLCVEKSKDNKKIKFLDVLVMDNNFRLFGIRYTGKEKEFLEEFEQTLREIRKEYKKIEFIIWSGEENDFLTKKWLKYKLKPLNSFILQNFFLSNKKPTLKEAVKFFGICEKQKTRQLRKIHEQILS